MLFCSKEINVLEKALFRRYDFFDSSADIFVCDAEGEIIAASDSVYGNAFVDSSTNSIFNKIPALGDMYHSGVESTQININGSKAYATLSSLQINDWQLGCIVQEDTAIEAYAPNLDNIRSLAISVSVIFIVAMGYIIFLLFLDFHRRRREISTIKRYYENYKTLLHELNCSVVEYDTETDMVRLLDDFEDSFGSSEWIGEGRTFERIHTHRTGKQ